MFWIGKEAFERFFFILPNPLPFWSFTQSVSVARSIHDMSQFVGIDKRLAHPAAAIPEN